MTVGNEGAGAVGVVGLGKMGLPMAGHLLAAGYEVHGYDVRSESVAAAAGRGVLPSRSCAELAADTTASLVVVGFDADVLAACLDPADGLLAGARPGHAVLICATVRPDTSLAVGRAAAERGVTVLDATLCRAEHAAVDATLLVLAGGDAEAVATWTPLLSIFATDVVRVGELGAGQVAKMLNNALLWAAVVADYEALRLGRRLGLDQEALRQALLLGSGANWALDTWNKARPMPWAEKDLAIALELAAGVDLPLPQTETVGTAIAEIKRAKADGAGVQASMSAFLEALEPVAAEHRG